MGVRPNATVHADLHEGYDDSGNVDVLSEEFINAFVYNFSHYDYADIKRGMTLNEVENQLNVSLEALNQDSDTETKYRANDVVVVMKDERVDYIYISPQETITKDQILNQYNAPTTKLSEHEIAEGHSGYAYKVLPDSNFEVIIAFNSDDNVLYIKHTLDEASDAVDADNALTFIKRGLALNSINPENYVFETPETTESGDLLINFSSDDLDGYLTLTSYGQLDVYNNTQEQESTVLIPYYGN